MTSHDRRIDRELAAAENDAWSRATATRLGRRRAGRRTVPAYLSVECGMTVARATVNGSAYGGVSRATGLTGECLALLDLANSLKMDGLAVEPVKALV
jgi:hypothetical protein